MAILNIISNRGDNAVTPNPVGLFEISSRNSERCSTPQVFRSVDSVAYFETESATHANPKIGDLIYYNKSKTILYNNSKSVKHYNINNGVFISLDSNSRLIKNPCS